jgi:hypothetical protein
MQPHLNKTNALARYIFKKERLSETTKSKSTLNLSQN